MKTWAAAWLAGFTLEGQPSLDTGAMGQGGKFFGRQSNVWLDRRLRPRHRRPHPPARARGFSIKYTATGWLSSDPLGNMALAVGSMFGPLMNGDAVGGRVSNALMYSSPRNLGGFSFSVLQSAGEGGHLLHRPGQAHAAGRRVHAAGDFTADVVYAKIPELAGQPAGADRLRLRRAVQRWAAASR